MDIATKCQTHDAERLIDANVLKAKVFTSSSKAMKAQAKTACINMIDKAPTIDAKLHGVWKTAKDGKYVCSVCGLPAPGGGLTSFCPNCGAKIDGK